MRDGNGCAGRTSHAATIPTFALVVAALLLACSGCVVGPDHYRPQSPKLPDRFVAAGRAHPDTPATDSQVVDERLGEWWHVFRDPVLDGLIARAIERNLGMQEALVRIAEARARRGVVKADFFPQFASSSSHSRKLTSENAREFVSISSTNTPFDLYSAGFDANWQIDLFGKIRRSVEAADAEILVAFESQRDVLVCVVADVATNYVLIRNLQGRLQIARENLRSQTETLKIVEQRRKAGLLNRLDIAQASTNVHTTASLIPTLEQQMHNSVNRLAVLLGEPPSAALLDFLGTGGLPVAPEQLAAGAPAELIRRRPDIRKAEAVVAAESARIGVAQAELYPQLSLTGAISADSRSLGQWFTGNSLSYGVGPSARWNVFNFGRIRNAVTGQELRHQRSIVQYQNAVLRAVEEVENGLIGIQMETRRVRSLGEAVKVARTAANLSREKYSRGLLAFQTVLDSERVALNLEAQLETSRGTVLLNVIRTYKALGGGWMPARPGFSFEPAPEVIDEVVDEVIDDGQTNEVMPEAPLDSEIPVQLLPPRDSDQHSEF